MMFICINQHLSFEAQLMKMLSNTEVKLNQSVAYKKKLAGDFCIQGVSQLQTSTVCLFNL